MQILRPLLFLVFSILIAGDIVSGNIKDIDILKQYDFTQAIEFIELIGENDQINEVIDVWDNQTHFGIDNLSSYHQYWGKVAVHNNGEEEKWVAKLGNIHIEEMEVFVREGDGKQKKFTAGQYVASYDKYFKQDNKPYVPLIIRPDDTVSVYFKFKFFEDVIGEKNIGFEVLPLRDFINENTDHHSYLLFILGAYFVLVFCAVILYVTTWEKLYLYYFLYIAIGAVFVGAYDGLISEFILGGIPYFFKYLWVIGCAAPTIYLLFMREFLSLSVTMRKFDRVVNVVVILSVFALIGSFILLFTGDHFDDASFIIHYMILGQMGFMLVTQFILMRRISTDYRIVFFMTGSFFYLGTSFYFEFQGFGTSLGIATAALIEGLIFASGMGYRLYLNQRKEQVRLEETVESRTRELQESNHEIQQAHIRIETLMKEMHHRIKNNLQMLVGLLNMQQRRIKEQPTHQVLDTMKTRVNAIGLIHEYLYKADDLKQIEIGSYIKSMVALLLEGRTDINVKYNFDVSNDKMDIDYVITVGLILHELVINSLKYGIQSENPTIEIDLIGNESELTMQVKDNGHSIDTSDDRDGFGFTIIKTLIDGKGSVDKVFSNEGGKVTVKLQLQNEELLT